MAIKIKPLGDRVVIEPSEDDAEKYTRHFGTDKEEKYFGDLIKNNQLLFDRLYYFHLLQRIWTSLLQCLVVAEPANFDYW